MEEGKTFYSTVAKEKYRIRQEINCRSKNIIYLVSCRKCPMQGVGQTENFQARVSNYISANNFGSNKGTQSKLGDFSYNLMPNKVKVANFQNWHQESRDLTIFGECLW